MELSIEQTLQQGVAAHKEGKLQDAERFYRAILQYQPEHPDANHNLGVLAVSVNKANSALPLFKTALEANPKSEQFWLSFIDALIKETQFENANLAIEQAKTLGVAQEKLNVLETQIAPTAQVNEPELAVQNKSLSLSQKRRKLSEQKKRKKKTTKQNLKFNNPSQQQLSSILGHYQNRQFNVVENLAMSLTQEFPKHPFGWKVLGAVLKQTGRIAESLTPLKKSTQLAPQDGEAHSNLGITLKELGRLDEALVSYKRAIALKPNFFEAYYNLSITLKELGRLDEALASYTQAIALKPDFAEAHSNLGNTLKELGRLDEALVSYKQAIALKTNYVEAHYNLGNTLNELGRLDECLVSYKQAIALKADYAEAHSNLGITLKALGRLDEALASSKQAIALKPDFAEAHNNLGNTLKALGRLDEALVSYKQAIALKTDYAEAHNNLGNTLKELGRLDEALVSYKQAIALKTDYVDGARNIVKLPVGQLDLDTLNLCEKTFNILDDSLEDQIKYFFFQGNLLKHRGFIEQSFNVFNKANKLKLEVSKDEIIVAANKNSDSLMRIDKWMPNPPELVGKRLAKLFIMGPSKSGKSSVEHILSESSQVKTLYEIIKHKELIKVYGCGKYSSETIFKNIFSQSEGKLFNQGYKIVTSTNPGSIFYSDYLMDMLPNAYFIFVKRDILDVSPEIFTAEYMNGNLYSYDINEISKYLDVYNRICEILTLKVPERCLTISFKDIIQAPEDVVDQISRLVGSSFKVNKLKRNVASFEYESLFRNHYLAFSDKPKS